MPVVFLGSPKGPIFTRRHRPQTNRLSVDLTLWGWDMGHMYLYQKYLRYYCSAAVWSYYQ